MKKIIFSLLAYILVGVSCKKNDTPDPVPTPAVKFMSLTAGSIWHYELINNIVPATTAFTVTSTSRDSSIGTRTYHVFTNSSAANEYYNITGNDYYNFRNLPSAIGGSSVEYNYLKDNLAVGANWSQSFPVTVGGFALNATLNNTITEKGITKTVKGVTYNNVFHITTTVSVTVSGIPLPSGALTTDIQTYYAEKYGLIQSNNKISLNYAGIVDNTDQQTNLISADIK
jgi:hypothetical protein